MSDLIERLRNVPDDHGMMYDDYDTVMEAADYIITLEAKLAVAREALDYYTGDILGDNPYAIDADDYGERARQALRKLDQ